MKYSTGRISLLRTETDVNYYYYLIVVVAAAAVVIVIVVVVVVVVIVVLAAVIVQKQPQVRPCVMQSIYSRKYEVS